MYASLQVFWLYIYLLERHKPEKRLDRIVEEHIISVAVSERSEWPPGNVVASSQKIAVRNRREIEE